MFIANSPARSAYLTHGPTSGRIYGVKPMSYSFNFTAPTKSDAINTAYDRLNDVATTQPSHKLDVHAAQNCVRELVLSLGDDPTSDIQVIASGSINARGQLSDEHAVGISINLSAQHIARK